MTKKLLGLYKSYFYGNNIFFICLVVCICSVQAVSKEVEIDPAADIMAASPTVEEIKETRKKAATLESELKENESELSKAESSLARTQLRLERLRLALEKEKKLLNKEMSEQVIEVRAILTRKQHELGIVRANIQKLKKDLINKESYLKKLHLSLDGVIKKLATVYDQGERLDVLKEIDEKKKGVSQAEQSYWDLKQNIAESELKYKWLEKEVQALKDKLDDFLKTAPQLVEILKEQKEARENEAALQEKQETLRRKIEQEKYEIKMAKRLEELEAKFAQKLDNRVESLKIEEQKIERIQNKITEVKSDKKEVFNKESETKNRIENLEQTVADLDKNRVETKKQVSTLSQKRQKAEAEAAEVRRIAEEKRMEAERLAKAKELEEKRIAEEKRREEERLAAEQRRILEEKRQEAERLAKAELLEKKRLAAEKARLEKEIARQKVLEERRLAKEKAAEDYRVYCETNEVEWQNLYMLKGQDITETQAARWEQIEWKWPAEVSKWKVSLGATTRVLDKTEFSAQNFRNWDSQNSGIAAVNQDDAFSDNGPYGVQGVQSIVVDQYLDADNAKVILLDGIREENGFPTFSIPIDYVRFDGEDEYQDQLLGTAGMELSLERKMLERKKWYMNFALNGQYMASSLDSAHHGDMNSPSSLFTVYEYYHAIVDTEAGTTGGAQPLIDIQVNPTNGVVAVPVNDTVFSIENDMDLDVFSLDLGIKTGIRADRYELTLGTGASANYYDIDSSQTLYASWSDITINNDINGQYPVIVTAGTYNEVREDSESGILPGLYVTADASCAISRSWFFDFGVRYDFVPDKIETDIVEQSLSGLSLKLSFGVRF